MRLSSIEAKKNIGWIIRERRIKKKISQDELCSRAGITQTFLSLLEHGKRNPSFEVLERIATVLGESAVTLEREAGDVSYDPEEKLKHLIKRLIRSRNRKKLNRLVEFIETLS